MFRSRLILLLVLAPLFAQDPVIIRPKEIDDVLTNPGMGFMTFQRFNGDELNQGLKWTEGFPISTSLLREALLTRIIRTHPLPTSACIGDTSSRKEVSITGTCSTPRSGLLITAARPSWSASRLTAVREKRRTTCPSGTVPKWVMS